MVHARDGDGDATLRQPSTEIRDAGTNINEETLVIEPGGGICRHDEGNINQHASLTDAGQKTDLTVRDHPAPMRWCI